MVGKQVTMSDIAKDMGVSTVTVSKAITGRDGVSPQVRERIRHRALQMGYVYSKGSKKNLKKQQYNVGILVAENFVSEETFYSKMYQRIMIVLAELNHFGMLEIVRTVSEKNATPPVILSDQKVDGLIMLGQMKKGYIEMIQSYGIPMVFLDFYDEDYKEDAIISDGVYGTCLLTKYLISRGHRKIGFIGSYMQTSSILDRYIGFYKAMIGEQLPIEEKWILEDRDENGKFIDIAFPQELPTAFVCNCDEVAFQVIETLKKRGYKIPEDISIVGFDNYIFAELSSPKITSFGVDMEAMIRNAVNVVISKILRKDYSVGRIVVSGDMYLRDSVKDVY